MAEQANGRRGCGVLACLTLAGIVGLAVHLYLSLRPEPVPDVKKLALSATARAADRNVAVQMDRQADQLRAALPWATYLGTTVADACSTDTAMTGFAITRQRWNPVTCYRATTVYEAFDGDFRQRLAQLDTVFAAAGWRAGSVATVQIPGEHPGLVSAFDWLHKPPDDPTPAEVAEAAGRRNVVSVPYYSVPISSDYVPPPGQMPPVSAQSGQPGATVQVAQAPYLTTIDDGTIDHDLAVEYASLKTAYYLQWQPYTHAQLATAYPAHGAVLAICITANYNTGPIQP